MHLKEIRTFNFRNLKNQTVSFSPGINLIYGSNGHGKTNLLEAVNLLCSGRSFRVSRIAELVSWNEKDSSVFGTIKREDVGDLELGVAVENKNRKAYVNGERVGSAEDFVGNFVCITFIPDDLTLVKGAPGERRRFVDKHLVYLEPHILKHIANYTSAVKNKNACLKNKDSSISQIKQELESWNHLMARHAAPIIEARRRFIENLSSQAAETHKAFVAEGEILSLSLDETISPQETSSDSSSEHFIFEQLHSVLDREIARRQSVIGPHRDDVCIKLSDVDARSFASQGQTRSIVLSMKLALIEMTREKTGETPVVLLDDVDSELDQGRRSSFFEMLFRQEKQVIITSTSTENIPLSKDRLHLLRVEKGDVFLESETV